MKIVYFISRLDWSGGAERVVSLKANWLAQNGHQVHIISFTGENSSFYPLVNGIHTHALGCLPFIGNFAKSYFRTTRPAKQSLKKILFEERFDVFIMAFPYLEHFVAGLKDGSKKIFEAHCAREFNYFQIEHSTSNAMLKIAKKMSQKQKERCAHKKFDYFVTLTQRDLQSRGNLSNGVVIANPSTFCSSERSILDQKRVLAVGRYSPEKGYQYLLAAWSVVEKKHLDWRLDMFGADCGEKGALLELKEQLGLKNVCLNGPTQQIKQEYLGSSIFAMSSINEGFPMVLTEAMVCGLPCVAFDCATGPKEIITHMQDGIIVPQVGDIDGLAMAICTLIEDEKLRKMFGENAQQNVQRFEIDAIMNQWLEIIK